MLGGVILFAAFLKSARDMYAADYGETSFADVGGVFLLGIGSLVLGVLLMIAYNVVAPAYFRGEVLNASTPVLVPEDGVPVGLATPDAPAHQRLLLPPEAERPADIEQTPPQSPTSTDPPR